MGTMIDQTAFCRELAQLGCTECFLVEWEANRRNPEHDHDFTARGLVQEGDFVIETAAWTRRFGPGEVFEVTAGTPHVETVGAQGVRLICGKILEIPPR